MSTNSHQANGDREVDLSTLSKGIGNAFESLNTFVFKSIRFFIRNIIVIVILLILGVVLGNYMDRTKVYKNEVIVAPNFQTANYLYEKIDLINAKAKEHDTLFLKALGIVNPKKFLKITVTPINDIYNFVNNNEYRYKTLELMAEDNDIEKILADKPTSRNYTYHIITYLTSGKTTEAKTLNPLMKYLNNSTVYTILQKQNVDNIKIKIQQNDILISQIDAILNQLGQSKTTGGSVIVGSSDSQIGDVINLKDQLIREQGNNRVALVNFEKIIKENSHTLNSLETGSINGKLKFILPFVFIFLFIGVLLFVSFYKKQAAKQKINN